VEILLVEDNPSDAELTTRTLKKHNLANSIVHMRDGAEALEFLFAEGKFASRDPNSLPQVVLLDLKMPKVDGIQVLKAMKSDDRTRFIPVVVLTSSREDRDLEECYRLGANSYIVKPVEFQAFVEVVKNLGLYWLLLNQPLK
jgi:CheY-like chemotaxis protein